MKKYLLLGLILMPFIVSAHGFHGGSQSHHNRSGSTNPPPVVVLFPVPVPTTPPVTSGSEISLNAYLTSYAAGDNSPAGNGTYIDGITGSAGGTGTYADPITMAVGYVGNVADYAPGTMFYVVSLEKYFKAGDTCADCHADKGGTQVHLDMWAGNYSGKGVLSCEDAVTGIYTVIENPKNSYPVKVGGLYNGSTCVL